MKDFVTRLNLDSHHQICLAKVKADCDTQLEKQKHEYENKLMDCTDKLEKQKKEYDEKIEQIHKTHHEALIRLAATHHNFVNVDEEDDVPQTVQEKLNEMEDSSPADYMMTLSQLTLNNVTIISRHPDHYVNATQLCQAGGKKFNDWYRLDSTKDLITVLSTDAGIPASVLVESKKDQTSIFRQGSWIHPDLAVQLAQWISPAFALQVARWVRGLFNDRVVQIDMSLMKEQQKRIEALESVCLSKRKREKYEGQNVVYLLTTEDHIKRRTYILGKTKNLENRLGTYNKTCDHTVIHYRECGTEENMNVVETLVLNRLNGFREQPNRDRVVLPDDKDVSFFKTAIDQCVLFVCKTKNF